MAGFTIYTGNMLEKLAGSLSENLKESPGGPFETELIITQSQGITQWLTLQLAYKLGVWSNFSYMMPNRFNHYLFKKLYPELPDSRYMDRELLRWQLMKQVPENLERSEFADVKTYLSGDTSRHRLFQLAGKLADLFDQYLTFRPEMVLEWERGNSGGWQGELWRRTVSREEILHPPALREKLANEVKDPGFFQKYELPARINLFGISYLPPYHLDIMRMLSRHIEVNLYIFSPTNQFWSHIMPRGAIIKKSGKAVRRGIPEEDLHLESGNSLLSSMGRAGRDFFRAIVDDETEPVELYSPPGRGTLLKRVQSGILNLEDEITPGGEGDALLDDGSLIINSCHSPMREAEVLYDFLLHRFNSESDLKPRDILIVTPDMKNYAPFIDAVFSSPEKEEMKIPVAFNDRGSGGGNGAAAVFFSICELEKKRYSAGSVLSLLESEPVSSRFGFSPGCVEKINSWVKSGNIRWGLGPGYREEIGLPPVEENSWLHGIKRILLGYSLPHAGGELPGGILPLDLLEGEDARLFGRFNSFIESVMKTAEIFKVPHSLEEWSRHLAYILESFIDLSSEDDPRLRSLNRGIGHLSSCQEASGFHEEIDLRIVREYLEGFMEGDNPPGRYVSGAVTLASVLPVRSIPFRIICMIGMNHDLFPRTDYESPFDLMKKNPRSGDRSLRDEDRYIFLESILSAREKLYISYTGQDIQDNSEISPSIVVSELMDFLADLFPGAVKSTAGSFFFKHPLQSFSSRYFTGEGPFISYSAENYKALRSRKPEADKSPFISRPLDTDNEPGVVQIDDLVSFFLSPPRYLLERIIGLDYRDRTLIPENSEPFEIEGLERYFLESELLESFLTGTTSHDILERVKHEGLLPHGTPGDVRCSRMLPGIARFSSRVRGLMKGDPLEPVELSFDLEGTRVQGMITTARDDIILHYRYGESRGRDFIRPWIEHLAAASAGEERLPRTAVLVRKKRTWKLGSVNDPRGILKDLISLYRKGTREPLPFFADTSYSYAEKINSGKPEDQALKVAAASLAGSRFSRGDLDDPYYSRCFKIEEINMKEFKELSLRVFGPVLKAAERT